MGLLANRVSASAPSLRISSRSRTPREAEAFRATPKISSACIRAPDPDASESRRAGAVAGPHHLFGLPLAAVGNAPQHPVIAVRDGVAGVPEFGADAAVARVLQHADALAVADLPTDLAAELEVVPLVVAGPALVGLHVNGVADVEHFVERLVSGHQADVGHADERNVRPAIGAHGAVRSRLANLGRGFAGGHVSGEQAIRDDGNRLRGDAFVVDRESAKTRPVFKARVAHHVNDAGPIAQRVELIEREEAHAGVVRLRAENAIELDGMPDGFVDLEPELAAVEDQTELALGALVRGVERHSLLGDARRVSGKVEFVDELVALELILAAEGIRVRPLLDVVVLEAVRRAASAADGAGLIDDA